jgi:glycosyltransferase involved in cell wall biosynthesis
MPVLLFGMTRQHLCVLHIVNSLDPGGMENGVVNLANAFGTRGWNIHVACLEKRGAFTQRLTHPERVTDHGKSGGFTPRVILSLARLICDLRPDVVHSHNLGPLIYGSLATLGGHRGTLLQGEHSLLTDEERTPRRIRQRRWLYRTCRAVHTVSRTMRTQLTDLGFSAEKITVVANGVDTTHFTAGIRQEARATLQLPADALVIGLVGRFGPFKRHALLIEAFNGIARQFPAAHLLLVGGGGSEEEPVRTHAAAIPAGGRIHFTGFQNDPRPSYHALDLLVIPSVNEGLSNAALEAMSCGVPVLAQAGCGHEEIISPGIDGWISRLETVEALATQLAALLATPHRLIDFGKTAREKVRQQFSLETMVAAYESLYRACAARVH